MRGPSLKSKVLTRSNAFLARKAKASPQGMVESITTFLKSKLN